MAIHPYSTVTSPPGVRRKVPVTGLGMTPVETDPDGEGDRPRPTDS